MIQFNAKISRQAQGLDKAPVVLKGASVLNVFTDEWVKADIAIHDDTIIGVGTYSGEIEYNYSGKYIVPGFIDSHLHLESTLVNPKELVFEASQVGTLGFIVDPHEAGNVAGIAGVEYMINETASAQGDVYVMAPSCVPAVPGEDNGAILDGDMLHKLQANPRILGLGEVMDCYSVINSDPYMMKKLDYFKDTIMDGHIIGLSPEQLASYRLAGITTNHECISYEEAKEQVKNGIYVWIREGSAAHNLDSIVKGLVEEQGNTERYGFCTDDKHIEDIRSEGHISYNIRRSIELGLTPIQAYKMASTHPAACYGLKDLGAIAPGYSANFVILNDEQCVDIHEVFYKGKPIERVLVREEKVVPSELLHTINIGTFTKEKLDISIEGPQAIINIVPGQIVTQKTVEEVPVENGLFKPNAEYNKITCIERYKASGRNGIGILKGFNLKNGAIASSFAHDSHNLIVVGDNDADMMVAIERIREIGGGYVIASKGKVVEELALEVMGLITNRPHEEVDAKVAKMKDIAYGMGVPKGLDPFINLSFLALTVIPEIRITTTGVMEF